MLGAYAAVLARGIGLAGTEVSLVAALRTFQHTEMLGLVMTIWSAGSAAGGLMDGACTGRSRRQSGSSQSTI